MLLSISLFLSSASPGYSSIKHTHTHTHSQQMFSPINWIRGFSIGINYLLRNRQCQNISQAKLPDPLESVEGRDRKGRGTFSMCSLKTLFVPCFILVKHFVSGEIIKFFQSQMSDSIPYNSKVTGHNGSFFSHKVKIMH